MYKFVDNSILHIDNDLKRITSNFKTLESLVQEDIILTNTVKNIVNLETELIEIGFKVQSLINTLKEHQNGILKILMNEETHGIHWLIQLIEPIEVMKLLEKAERKIPDILSFPKKDNSGIYVDFLKLIEVSHTPLNNQILLLKLKIPLVLKHKFIAYRGRFIPQINGSLKMSINMEEDIIIKEVEKDWGFILTNSQYKDCMQLANSRICNLEETEIRLSTGDSCLLILKYKNSTENCNTKILKVEHDVWFETEEPNVWEYISPTEIKINIFHGSNNSHLTIRGSGKIMLTPNMIIETNNIKILYSNVSLKENLSLTSSIRYSSYNFSMDNVQMNLIPSLNTNISMVSFYDHKKLFDLGINIEDLKKDRPFLENMIYSPLESGWSIGALAFGTTIMLTIIILSFVFYFKGKISCVNKIEKVPERPRRTVKDVEIIHNIPNIVINNIG